MLCGFSSLWWPFGWNWSCLRLLGIIWRTCGSKCRGEGGGIFPTLCIECCLVFNVFLLSFLLQTYHSLDNYESITPLVPQKHNSYWVLIDLISASFLQSLQHAYCNENNWQMPHSQMEWKSRSHVWFPFDVWNQEWSPLIVLKMLQVILWDYCINGYQAWIATVCFLVITK